MFSVLVKGAWARALIRSQAVTAVRAQGQVAAILRRRWAVACQAVGGVQDAVAQLILSDLVDRAVRCGDAIWTVLLTGL
jgi:hypothetical protein